MTQDKHARQRETSVHPAVKHSAVPHEEKLLDSALKHTFPASDPVAELPEAARPDEAEKIAECLLDDALEFSFPASDPISISSGFSRIEKAPDVVPAKEDHQLTPEQDPKKSKHH
jgi:hypothetical protein